MGESNSPKTGPWPVCNASCQAKKWLDHIKALSHLGRTAITFTVGAAASADAALNSVASSIISNLAALAVLGTVNLIGGQPPQPGTGTRDDNHGCDTSETVDGSRTYWGLQPYQNPDGSWGCRATGAFATLTAADLRDRRGLSAPTCARCEVADPMRTLMQLMGEEGTGSPGSYFDAGHLLGYAMGGRGDTQKNLVPLYNIANRGAMNSTVERRVRAAMRSAGATVYVQVRPVYPDGSTGVPDSLDYSFQITNRDGSTSVVKCIVGNVNSPGGSSC